MKIRYLVVLLTISMVLVSGCVQTEQQTEKNIVETAQDSDSFNTLVQAVQEAELVETLSGEGPFTVFAPTDEAFDKLPEGTLEELLNDKEKLRKVLTYHVVSGKYMANEVVEMDSIKTVQGENLSITANGGVMVNDANVTQTDIESSNGVIHAIDKVILPPSMTETEEMNIVETAISEGSFNTLVQAVQAAGLENTLRGDGPYTVFAPTDEAFEKLPEGTIENLLADEEQLTNVLTYHVVSGEYMANEVVEMESIETLQGSTLEITTTDSEVNIGNATVVQTDIKCSNGVIHVIDEVLIP
ncbi:beta-Ig-H3/fasciclin [Methanohalobium evestigatum Z-7303]|uniref:Beta-Ig-H3/fasciclin n=1 Tax=Methanohalobium evestigatum (strain ATCC BAA-1072 / DSM 3721 / NBRC 107634 / OCM 161 / Z-7303) TaxID=644295 RepID=D7E7B7_METEZ|nr:fasciclin domain-containing protein [Methanohalobium evestigatum]ADI73866.1 beta-Ig-H3/fasciclin [Methanohalobium evestigatum Z-7303]